METSSFFEYIIKSLTIIKLYFTKPIAFIFCIPAFIAPAISSPQKAIALLGLFFILDFITGIAASYLESREISQDHINGTKEYVLKSSKLRLSVIKFITYGLAVLIAYGIDWAFITEYFKPNVIFKKMTLTTTVAAFCCTIEVYSILFENIKRMGFDIIAKIKEIFTEGWKLYKIFKGEEQK